MTKAVDRYTKKHAVKSVKHVLNKLAPKKLEGKSPSK